MRNFLTFVILFSSISAFAQQVFTPQNHDFGWERRQWMYADTSQVNHIGIGPVRMTVNQDTAYKSWYNTKYNRQSKQKLIGRKVFQEHLLRAEGKDFRIWADALFNFQGGQDLNDTSSSLLTTNTRGVQIQGYITDKVSFYSSFYENQSYFPSYLTNATRSIGVIPGQGPYKGLDNDGFDYNNVSGVVHYQATKNLGFQFGHDKLFIGHGYRSVLLSDNAFNYPFLRASIELFDHKLHYETSFAMMQERERSDRTLNSEALYKRKQSNIRYISFKPSKKFEIGISEVVMWQHWDDSLGTLPQEPLFYSPIPFLSSFVDVGDTLNRGYIGLNAMYSPFENYVAYGQLLYANESLSGYQIGVKLFDVLGVNGLYLQAEYNSAEEAYGDRSRQTDLYHFGQPLAFVQGDESNEFVGVLRYTYRNFFVQARANLISRSSQDITIFNGEVGYLFNPRYNFNVYAGGMLRESSLSTVEATQWFYFGFRTSISNYYYDL